MMKDLLILQETPFTKWGDIVVGIYRLAYMGRHPTGD